MLRSSRLRRQDGFIREIIWVAVAIAIVAVVLLDGMSIFTAHQSVRDDSATAAREARTEYAQSLSVPAAKLAAQQYLAKSDLTLVSFSAVQNAEGGVVFSVKATAEAKTYAFRFLKVIPGLKKWEEKMTHPSATSTAQ